MKFKASFLFVLTLICGVPLFAQSVIQTKTEPDLIPEGIAVDSVTGNIYVTSIYKRKIIVVDTTGGHRDFISSGRDGFLKGVGIKVDYKRRWLWVVSNDREGPVYISRIHAFDLVGGKLIQYDELKEASAHLFNDIAIADNGDLYITDSEYKAVYLYKPKTRIISLFHKSEDLTYANGILFLDDKLYVASEKGMTIFDLKNKSHRMVTEHELKYSNGFDGLVAYKNEIIGVYNLPVADKDMAIVRYHINKAEGSIVLKAVLDIGNPHFHAPTTAAISGRYLYVLANSHIDEYNKNGESAAGILSKLSPVVILRYRL